MISPAKRVALVSAPILLTLFSVAHGFDWVMAHGMDHDPDAFLEYIASIRTRWLVVHVVGIALFPLLGLVVWWMLPARRIASAMSRVALAVYIVTYAAFDALVGIGMYVLVHYRDTVPATDRAAVDGVIFDFFWVSDVTGWFGLIASWAWVLGLFFAAVALGREGRWRVVVPLAGAGIAMGLSHFPPEGAIAGIMLGIATWQFLGTEHRVSAPARRDDESAGEVVAAVITSRP